MTTDANTGGSFNRYAYANNSPYKYVDPDGRAIQLAGVLPSILASSGLLIAGHYVLPGRQGREDTIRSIVNAIRSDKADAPKSDGNAEGAKIEPGKQGKHVFGHNNFEPGKSELTHPDPQSLVDKHKGTGQQVGSTPVGEPASKERIDFGTNIGIYVDPATGERTPTTNGIIHESKKGVHVVPSRPTDESN